MRRVKNKNLAEYTSWLIGGPAEYFSLPTTLDEIKEDVTWAQSEKLPITILGDGSNVLISDVGIKGLTICMRSFKKMEVKEVNDQLEINADAGVSKSELLKLFLKHQLEPALFLAGLPGDVGGGIVMNAGVAENFFPREFEQIVEEFEVLHWDGTIKIYPHEEVKWKYRHSEGWGPGIILRAKLSWPMVKKPKILELVSEANKVRFSKQPLDMPSCGSVFVNPPGLKAAQLIDSCGLKGHTIGGAQVSTKHANFIVNLGGAKAQDVSSLILHIQNVVEEKYRVKLKTEVVKLGF